MKSIDALSIAAIRSLCIDEINKPNSGHPGVALGAAPILYTLYKYHLVSDPKNPKWVNRDRFILSGGHASSLLYVMLHVCGYKVSMNDIKSFRVINSLTTGHPEYGHTEGVDNTSGPLGQGLSQAVGVAMAEVMTRAKYTSKLINHYTYCMLGDGDLEEGISQEAISVAGLHKLNKLICLFDSNGITLDGKLSNSSDEDQEKRFKASHWNVLRVNDGNDVDEISKAISLAKKSDKPTLIIVNTVIGYGSSRQGTSKVHGAPLGKEDGEFAKASYKFKHPEFYVPKEVYDDFKKTIIKRGQLAYSNYLKTLNNIKKNKIKLYNDYTLAFDADISKLISNYEKNNKVSFAKDLKEATRKSSGNSVNYFAKAIPFMVGGSADVAGSVLTTINDEPFFSKDNPDGRNISFGIREFQMAGIQNGMLLHGGLRPYVGCFLVFSDYMKAAIRMSAISNLPAIYIFSHDSIYVGEDGPTHEPIEQVAMLRCIPNVNVIRPCDARETFGAWKIALTSKKTPTCIITTRQGVPLNSNSSDTKMKKGAYIISKEETNKFVTIIASGSEVSLAMNAKALLNGKVDIRVVSMPSMELFNKLNEKEQNEILGSSYNRRIAVEALTSFGWHRYAKNVMSIDRYGLSGKGDEIAKYLGFTSENLAKLAIQVNKNGK